jgi:hypothetical protein
MTQPAIMGLLGVFTSLMFFFASFTEIPRLMSFLFYFGNLPDIATTAQHILSLLG